MIRASKTGLGVRGTLATGIARPNTQKSKIGQQTPQSDKPPPQASHATPRLKVSCTSSRIGRTASETSFSDGPKAQLTIRCSSGDQLQGRNSTAGYRLLSVLMTARFMRRIFSAWVSY
jgi:hypothetical protein